MFLGSYFMCLAVKGVGVLGKGISPVENAFGRLVGSADGVVGVQMGLWEVQFGWLEV